MGMRRYRAPFSSRPWTEYVYISELPALDKSEAKSLWMRIGVTFGLVGGGTAIAFGVAGKLDQIDPMLSSGLPLNLVFWIPLLATTGLIGLKQWRYYYGNESPKDGIFIEKIRQANEREMIMDVVLSIAGGVLIGFCFWPSFWFIMFALYSFLVILRCYFTLMRPKYARKARLNHEDVPVFIEESLNAYHNGLLVKAVLLGWIVSDVLYIVYDICAFLLCFYLLEKLGFAYRLCFFVVILGILFLLFLHIVRKYSYKWGLWLQQLIASVR
jgi:hypothetical protein